MWFSSWLQKRTVASKRRPALRFRPQLEALEDRAVPATFIVTTTADVVNAKDGVLSLREAIIAANASAKTADTIVLPAGNYTLTRAGAGEDGCLTGDLDISGPLSINGAGAGSTVVDAADLDRVFQMYGYAVTFSGMSIQGGNAVIGSLGPNGGGIYNPYTAGALTVNDCVISGNTAGGYGGGIYSGGSLTVKNSVISNNLVSSGGWGGGIYSVGTLTVSNSTISGNSAPGNVYGGGGLGGGISQGPGTMTIQYSTLSGNSAVTGGAIYVNSTKYYPSVVQTCTISNNTASKGGGVATSSGILTVQNSTLSGNSAFQGGALFNQNATLTVNNCIVSGNSASQGGGIYLTGAGNATVLTSTLTGNSATEFGGGIANRVGSRLTVNSSTVLDNFAPLGGDLYSAGFLAVYDSIIGDRYDV